MPFQFFVSFCRHPFDGFAKNTFPAAGRQARRGNRRKLGLSALPERRSRRIQPILATHRNNFPMFCKRKKKPKKRAIKTGSATASRK
jgi:hypothetical protein